MIVPAPAELDSLPADPAQLREELKRLNAAKNAGDPFEEKLPIAATLLYLPLRPAVRAGLLRLLAELPTTKVREYTTDPLGRPGLTLTFWDSKGTRGDGLPSEWMEILDPETGQMLAGIDVALADGPAATKGEPMHYTAHGPDLGWTDERPVRPEGCQDAKPGDGG